MRNMLQLNSNGRRGVFKTGVFALLFAVGCLLVLPGCRSPIDSRNAAENRTGTLSLTIGERGLERTIMPETKLGDFVAFNLRFVARSDDDTYFTRRWTGSTGAIELDVGVWDLHVTAYLPGGEHGEYLDAARGGLYGPYAIEVLPGETAFGSVRLYPITEGEGTFSWDIGLPGNVVTARMEIKRVHCDGESYSWVYYLVGGRPLVAVRHGITLPAGRYRVVIAVENNLGERAMASEILHVYRNMTSGFALVLDDSHFIGPSPELGLAEWLALLRAFAQSGGEYLIELSGDEYITPEQAILPGSAWSDNRNDITITLRGAGPEPSNVRLSANGVLFQVDSGITLILDENVTLVGRSADGNGGEDNNASLVSVGTGGALVMNKGARITGNTATGNWIGGGVYVLGGTFVMHGGEVFGNTATGWATAANSSSGGGVYVRDGTFIMHGGKVSGNTATGWGSSGGGVRLNGGTFTMHGGEVSGNTATGTNIGGGVLVGGGSTFTMQGGEVSGNTATGGGSGGGVRVSGTFTMQGGEVSGNTATGDNSGGGVRVLDWSGATFRIINGVIYGNEAEHGNRRNMAYGFAALALSNFGTATAQHGTFYDGNWQSKGDLFSRNLTIHVIDGVLVNIPMIAITTQPAAMTNITVGSISGNLTVAASVTQGASLSYQWFANTTNSNVGGTAIWGATGANFAIPTGLVLGTHYFFVEVSATEGAMPVRSSVAVVNVSAVITITTQPTAITNEMVGSISGSLTVAAYVTHWVTSLSYQWFSNTTNSNVGGTAISGATGTSFAIPTDLALGTHYFFVEVRATEGAMPVRSSVAVVNVIARITYLVVANGTANTVDSTQLTFTFSREPVGLVAGNITLTAGTGSATRGTLSGSGTTWTLGITGVRQGNITVAIDHADIEAGERTVAVHGTLPTAIPLGGSFTDTDHAADRIGGVITWTLPANTGGVLGYRIYLGQGSTSATAVRLPGTSAPVFVADSPAATSVGVPAGTVLPSGATWFLIYSFNVHGNSAGRLAVPIADIIEINNTFGSFTVNAVSTRNPVTFASNVLTIRANGRYTISGTSTIDRIDVATGLTDVNITLSSVNINVSALGSSGGRAFDIVGSSTVNLTLTGNNVLRSGSGNAGIGVGQGASLLITGESTGSLDVTGGDGGGTGTVASAGGAGIGGRSSGNAGIRSAGNITIMGGTVTARGGNGSNGSNAFSGVGGSSFHASGGSGGGAGIGGAGGGNGAGGVVSRGDYNAGGPGGGGGSITIGAGATVNSFGGIGGSGGNPTPSISTAHGGHGASIGGGGGGGGGSLIAHGGRGGDARGTSANMSPSGIWAENGGMGEELSR